MTVTLSSLGDIPARDHVKQTVAADPLPDQVNSDLERWRTAAHAVMVDMDLPESWPHVRRAFDDAELGRAVIDGLAAASPGRLPAGVAELEEADLADL